MFILNIPVIIIFLYISGLQHKEQIKSKNKPEVCVFQSEPDVEYLILGTKL